MARYRTKQQPLVTRESLEQLLAKEELRGDVIGRALVRLFQRQEETEKQTNVTDNKNNVGFSAADAKEGSITAKTYIKHKHLLPFQIKYWMEPVRGNKHRICMYTRQLNDCAIRLAKAKEKRANQS